MKYVLQLTYTTVQRLAAPQGRQTPDSSTGRPNSSEITLPPKRFLRFLLNIYPQVEGERLVV